MLFFLTSSYILRVIVVAVADDDDGDGDDDLYDDDGDDNDDAGTSQVRYQPKHMHIYNRSHNI